MTTPVITPLPATPVTTRFVTRFVTRCTTLFTTLITTLVLFGLPTDDLVGQGVEEIGPGGILAPERTPWNRFANPAAGSRSHRLLVTAGSGLLSSGQIAEAGALYAGPLGEDYSLSLAVASSAWGPWREVDGAIGGAATFGRIAGGLRLRCTSTTIERYRSSLHPSLDVGLLLQIDSALQTGLVLTNVTGTDLHDRPLPQRLALGFAWGRPGSPEILLDLLAEPGRGTSIGLTAAHSLLRHIDLRTGLATLPATLLVGIGLHLDPLRIDYAARFRPDDGISWGVGGGISW